MLSDQRSALIRQLEPQVLTAMKDQHGNHVIQKALEFGDQDDLEFVFRSLRGKVRELACHATACRVVQKAMDRFTEPRNAIIDEVLPHTLALANDKYGNYVIQHVLEMGRPEDKTRIIDMVLGGSIVHLSKQKFASNVVEKCVMNGTPEEKLKIETQMTATGPDGNSFLYSMIVDQYANYVIRKYSWNRCPASRVDCADTSQKNTWRSRRTSKPSAQPCGRPCNGRGTPDTAASTWIPLDTCWRRLRKGWTLRPHPLRRCSWTSARQPRRQT